MNIVERFLNYTKFDTQSSEDSQTVPSTSKQLIFAEFLKKELENEVGAAMEGYELAIEEAVKLLENNFNMPNDFSQIFREHLGQL